MNSLLSLITPKFDVQVFGIPLTQLLKRESSEIPEIISLSLEFLEQFAIEQIDLFRITGTNEEIVEKKKQVSQIARSFDRGIKIDFSIHKSEPQIVSAVLRLFLLELPDCLMTFNLYEDFLKILLTFDSNQSREIQNHSKDPLLHSLGVIEKPSNFFRLLQQLPSENFILYKRLMFFFCKVLNQNRKNRQTVTSISSVFGPILIQPPQSLMEGLSEPEILLHQGHVVRVMKHLISSEFLKESEIRIKEHNSKFSISIEDDGYKEDSITPKTQLSFEQSNTCQNNNNQLNNNDSSPKETEQLMTEIKELKNLIGNQDEDINKQFVELEDFQKNQEKKLFEQKQQYVQYINQMKIDIEELKIKIAVHSPVISLDEEMESEISEL